MQGRDTGRILLAASVASAAALCGAMPQTAQEKQQACLSNLKQMALGIMMYVQDYDERFPPMIRPAPVQNRIYPYVKNRQVFTCPDTNTAYLPNPALNYLVLSKVSAPAHTIMLRDDRPHRLPDGRQGWNVAWADGHVKLAPTEPRLGRPAPSPPPTTRAQTIRGELEALRRERERLDARIRALESQQRHQRRR